MAMSRKHYRKAADVVRGALPEPGGLLSSEHYGRYAAAQEIAEGLARMFAADNPNFRREQFLSACGL